MPYQQQHRNRQPTLFTTTTTAFKCTIDHRIGYQSSVIDAQQSNYLTLSQRRCFDNRHRQRSDRRNPSSVGAMLHRSVRKLARCDRHRSTTASTHSGIYLTAAMALIGGCCCIGVGSTYWRSHFQLRSPVANTNQQPITTRQSRLPQRRQLANRHARSPLRHNLTQHRRTNTGNQTSFTAPARNLSPFTDRAIYLINLSFC